MSSKKESLKLQEMGPKKYYKMVEEQNKFYDKNMAGKRNPKTGEYYYDIQFNKPEKISCGKYIAEVECVHCKHPFSIRETTAFVVCSNCKKGNCIRIDGDEITVSPNN